MKKFIFSIIALILFFSGCSKPVQLDVKIQQQNAKEALKDL